MGSNMGARTLIVMVLTVAIIGSCYGINCGKVVTVESKELLSYLASVNFPAPKSFNGQWNLEMKTDVPFTFLGGWHVIIEDNGPNKTANFKSADQVEIKAGQLVSFDFRIRWAPEAAVPRVEEIIWEGKQICQGVDTTSPNAITKRSSKGRKLYNRKSGYNVWAN